MENEETKLTYRQRVSNEAHQRKIDRFLEKAEKARLEKERKYKEAVSRRSKKYNLNQRKKKLKSRMQKGDVHNWYNIFLVKNKVKIKHLYTRPWKTDAYALFSKEKEKNQVKFPRCYERDKYGETHFVKYELLLVENVDPDNNGTTSLLRNEFGRFVEHTVIGKNAQIIDKCPYYIEDDFYVYGYHPLKERKNYDFILNELFLKKHPDITLRRVYVFYNKLIVKSDISLDIITCRNAKDARRLYNQLLKDTFGVAYIVFNYTPLTWQDSIMDEVRELTGWDRYITAHGNW